MGDFDKYTVIELRDMVDPDRPDEMAEQAASWAAFAQLLITQHDTLRTRLDTARDSWSGAAADVFFTEMDKRCRELDEAAGTAKENAAVWGRIRDHADYARSGVFAIYTEWENSGGSSTAPDDENRKPFDERARKLMSLAAEETDVDHRRLRYHQPFTPVTDAGGGDDISPDGSGGATPGSPATHADTAINPGAMPGRTIVGPTDTTPAPALQSAAPPVTAVPTPAPPPATPPVSLPPPAMIAPVAIPPTGVPIRVTPPPSAPLTPRPPTRTVPSVIGSRPGTTGMAPVNRTSPTNQVVRPVIGTRPGTTASRATPVPNRPLIGKSGVVKGPGSDRRQPIRATRTPKPEGGDRSVNRGVIRGARTAPSEAMSRELIKSEVRRLSRRDDEPDENFWKPNAAFGPAIITGRTDETRDSGPH